MMVHTMNSKCQHRLRERFDGLFEEGLIDEICKVGVLKKVDAYTELMAIGETIHHIPLIISGSLKVMTEDANGEELLLYYLELGDTCAMTLKCCSGSANSVIRACTEESAEILFIPVENMDKWMVSFSSWRNFVLDSFNTRMHEMLQAIDNLAFHNMEERLVKYLRERAMVMRSGHLHITHLQIANDLHSSRVVISRLMKKLESEGLIKQYRNKIDIVEFNPKEA